MLRLVLGGILLMSIIANGTGQPIEIDAQKPFIPEGKPLKGLVITLDAGHGGSAHTGGYGGSARGTKTHVIEENLNMLVAGELRHHLVDAGAEVHMTRWDDRKVSNGTTERVEELGARVNMAEETKSHLYLGIHHNSSVRKTADGVMILTWPIDNKGNPQPLEESYAEIMRQEVEKKVHHKEKFDLWKYKHLLVSQSDIPSVVVEFGFLSNPEFDEWVTVKGQHRVEAIGAYNGVVRMWQEHRKELEALRLKLFPELKKQKKTQLAVDTTPLGPPPELPELCKELWPVKTPPKTVSDFQWILNHYRSSVLTDRSFFYFRAAVSKKKNEWVLTGATNLPQLKKTPESILQYWGIKKVRNEIELLPSSRLGDNQFGIVSIPMCLIWGEPKEGAAVQTQALLGEPLYLLDVNQDSTYYLAHGRDGYIGWVRQDALVVIPKKEFSAWVQNPHAVIVKDYMKEDLRFPTGGILPIISIDTNSTLLRLPRGYRATGQKSEIAIPTEYLRLPDKVSPGRIAALTAVDYLTTPYVFGARSKIGIDCSGLTEVSYMATGITLPRDARQQILMGQLVGTSWNWDNLQPGDLIFFVSDGGRVIHTGVSLGGLRYIHASPPEVQVNSLDPNDPLYSSTWHDHFAFARRMFIE